MIWCLVLRLQTSQFVQFHSFCMSWSMLIFYKFFVFVFMFVFVLVLLLYLFFILRHLNLYSFTVCAFCGQLICDYFSYAVVFRSYFSHSITFRLVNERLNWTDQNISLSYLNSGEFGYHHQQIKFCLYSVNMISIFPPQIFLLITMWWEST